MKPLYPHLAGAPREIGSALCLLCALSGLLWPLAASESVHPAPAGAAPPTLETDGTIVVARAPAGALLAYTLNGVDPRGPADMLGLGARLTDEPLVVGAGTLLVARTLDPAAVFPRSPWSPLRRARDAVRVDAGAAGPLFAPRLANLSALVNVGAADVAPVIGFVVGGRDPHRFLIRAVGPALAAFGLAGALPDPEIALRGTDGSVLARTNRWTADPLLPALCAGLGAFPLPDASGDGALVVQLAPGAYTLEFASASGQAGIALAEIYDADRASGFESVSIRATIGPARRAFTGGFVVEGTLPKKMLVRAIGPGLGARDGAGPGADPRLTVFSGGNAIAHNDDWDAAAGEAAAAAAASGAFQLVAGSRDAALVLTLAPGAYTAQLSVPGESRGVFVLEACAVP